MTLLKRLHDLLDKNFTPGATYTYRLTVVNIAGSSTYSNLVAVPVATMSLAPRNFTATNGQNSANQRSVVRSWLDNSTDETGFTIERATNSTFTSGYTATNIAAASSTGTRTLNVSGLRGNIQYWFRIRANNGTIICTAWRQAASKHFSLDCFQPRWVICFPIRR